MASTLSCSTAEHGDLSLRPRALPSVRERAARMLRAAGDPERLALLELLDGGETCVTELAMHSGDAMPTVSQRLRLLKIEGLVTTRREGKHVFYALADEHVRRLLHNIMEHASERSAVR